MRKIIVVLAALMLTFAVGVHPASAKVTTVPANSGTRIMGYKWEKGDAVVFRRPAKNRVLMETNTHRNRQGDLKWAELVFQADGNLVGYRHILDTRGKRHTSVVFNAKSNGKSVTALHLQSDCNVVLYTSNPKQRVAWASGITLWDKGKGAKCEFGFQPLSGTKPTTATGLYVLRQRVVQSQYLIGVKARARQHAAVDI